MEPLTPAQRAAYLSHRVRAGYEVRPEVKRRIVFDRLNLAAPPFPMNGPFDVVFCRNVMIYFDDEMKQRVVNMFSDQLTDDGWLFIGHSESIRGMDTPFESQPHPQGFCYRKCV